MFSEQLEDLIYYILYPAAVANLSESKRIDNIAFFIIPRDNYPDTPSGSHLILPIHSLSHPVIPGFGKVFSSMVLTGVPVDLSIEEKKEFFLSLLQYLKEKWNAEAFIYISSCLVHSCESESETEMNPFVCLSVQTAQGQWSSLNPIHKIKGITPFISDTIAEFKTIEKGCGFVLLDFD